MSLSFADQLPDLHPHHQNSCVKTSSAPNEIHGLQIQVSSNVKASFLSLCITLLSPLILHFLSLCLSSPPVPHLRLAKSTLTLIPLLGIHQVVFIFVTDESTKTTIGLRLTKLFIDLFFSSFQVELRTKTPILIFMTKNHNINEITHHSVWGESRVSASRAMNQGFGVRVSRLNHDSWDINEASYGFTIPPVAPVLRQN